MTSSQEKNEALRQELGAHGALMSQHVSEIDAIRELLADARGQLGFQRHLRRSAQRVQAAQRCWQALRACFYGWRARVAHQAALQRLCARVLRRRHCKLRRMVLCAWREHVAWARWRRVCWKGRVASGICRRERRLRFWAACWWHEWSWGRRARRRREKLVAARHRCAKKALCHKMRPQRQHPKETC